MGEPNIKYPSDLDDINSLIEVKDKKQTTLSATLTIGETTEINVASTTGFPNKGYITIDNEIIYYEAITATKFQTLTRSCQSTTAAAHTTGVKIYLNVLAIHHEILKQAITAIETELGINPKGTKASVVDRLNKILTYVAEYRAYEVDNT